MIRTVLPHLRILLVLPALVLAQDYRAMTSPLGSAPSPTDLDRYYVAEARRALAAFDAERLDPAAIIRMLEQRSKDLDRVSIFGNGRRVARQAALVGRLAGETRWTRLAVDLAETLYHRYVLPSGAFIERDRAPWIEPNRGWRTIPWGVNFRGNEILDAYHVPGRLQGHLGTARRQWTSLRKPRWVPASD